MRLTRKELDGAESRVNASLRTRGYEVQVNRRYNYYAVDLARVGSNGIVKTIRAGMSAQEVYALLTGMETAIDIGRGRA